MLFIIFYSENTFEKIQEFLPNLRSNPRRKSFHCDDVTPPRSPRFPSKIVVNGSVVPNVVSNSSFVPNVVSNGSVGLNVVSNGSVGLNVVSNDIGNQLLMRRGENSPFTHRVCLNSKINWFTYFNCLQVIHSTVLPSKPEIEIVTSVCDFLPILLVE